ncbi:SPP1 family predicted phage head-tail adaptor [Maritalea mobilis]|uniref:SPP1 family predicted phage head-tail adaptor n=1 Tax=Maritalea mobilis TaxID=483324 RepID=A0A4V3DAS2_9HYPH|nr:phage head closure protein [Maritalea mobilis]TDQ63574.1 SPP1 family predicted phage head-tail adaptor [Maritalea mobilis]
MSKLAGKRDRRIKIQRYTTEQNGLGEEVKNWSALATVWANVTPISDGERIEAQQVNASISTRFTILHSSTVADVNAKDRIEYPVDSGTYYDIYGVKELGRREGLEITATAPAD